MNSSVWIPAALCALVWALLSAARQDDALRVGVHGAAELEAAILAAKPGTRIEIAPGNYAGGLRFVDLHGAPGKPIVIAAADAAHPPVLQGGSSAIQLCDPAYVELRDLAFEGQTDNGINIDDGGTSATPAHHVLLLGLAIRDVSPEGNHDGIKLSGLDDFRVEHCAIRHWGGSGSAIDMVGCHRGLIEQCSFEQGREASNSSGVQLKGGSRDVRVRGNCFHHAGGRAVNIGGSTGLEYFRPPLAEWDGPRCEAKDIRVEGNTFIGSDTPVAFVGVDGAVFRFNTVYQPERWALRILQENREQGFVPSRNGEFSDNLVVFRSDHWSSGGVNSSDATEPATFRFTRNAWYCSDAPSRTRELVHTPVAETNAAYGVDPMFMDAAAGDLRLKPGSPLFRQGAQALPAHD